MNFIDATRRTLGRVANMDIGNLPVSMDARAAHREKLKQMRNDGYNPLTHDTVENDGSIKTKMWKFSRKYYTDPVTGKWTSKASWPMLRAHVKTYVHRSGEVRHEIWEE